MTVPTPREVFAQMRQEWTGRPGPLRRELYTEDVIVETPFSPPGHPARFEGRDAWLAFADPARAAIPLHLDGGEVIAIHDTTDPATIVVEYTLTATSTRTGRRGTAPFIAVLTVRDGRVAGWREYQNPLAMAQISG